MIEGMDHDFWVTIHGERGAEWERITGTNRFPVQSPFPIPANLPGIGEAHVYLLALESIDEANRHRIIEHLSSKFGLSAAEAADEITKAAIPILETDCSVMILNPMRWCDCDEDEAKSRRE